MKRYELHKISSKVTTSYLNSVKLFIALYTVSNCGFQVLETLCFGFILVSKIHTFSHAVIIALNELK